MLPFGIYIAILKPSVRWVEKRGSLNLTPSCEYSPTLPPHSISLLSLQPNMLKLWVCILMQTSGGRIPLHVLAAELVHISTENKNAEKFHYQNPHTCHIYIHHIPHIQMHTYTHNPCQHNTSEGFTAGDLVWDVRVYMCVGVWVWYESVNGDSTN